MGCDLKKDMCNYLHVGKHRSLFTKAKVSKHPLIVAFLIARCGGPWYDSNASNFERLGITSRDKRKQWMREQTAAQLERHNEAEGLTKAPKPSKAALDAEREFADGTPGAGSGTLGVSALKISVDRATSTKTVEELTSGLKSGVYQRTRSRKKSSAKESKDGHAGMEALKEAAAKAAESEFVLKAKRDAAAGDCLLYTSPSPRDRTRSRMPSSA